MERHKMDPVQARTYVINNRHNHTTALYYLLELKIKQEGPQANNLSQENSANRLQILSPQSVSQPMSQQMSQPVSQPAPQPFSHQVPQQQVQKTANISGNMK